MELQPNQPVRFTLGNYSDDGVLRDPLGGAVELESGNLGISISLDGHGMHSMQPGHGSVIFIEQMNGVARILIWSKITEEDPTHIIPLDGALESKRPPVCGIPETVVQEYIRTNGVRCPYCKSDDLNCGNYDTQDHAVFRQVTCGSCGNTWTDEYSLTGITTE